MNAIVATHAPTRMVPHNYEAEQQLLGAILANNRALEKVVEFLRPEHFAEPVHGRIYDACVRLHERNALATPVTLKNFFAADGGLEEIGGTRYLAELANSVVSIINACDFGHIIHDLHIRRELIELGENLVNAAYMPSLDETAHDLLNKTGDRICELADAGQVDGGPQAFRPVVAQSLARAEMVHKADGRLVGMSSGMLELDRRTGGLQPPDLIILAGRPSMGKTALATNIAFNAAAAHYHDKSQGGVVLVFSQEMSATQLADRILAEVAEVALHRVRNGPLSHEEMARLGNAEQNIGDFPLLIDDTAALSASSIRTRARRVKRKHGLGLIVIDYLQLMSGTGENRVQEVSKMTKALKALAKDLNVPIIVLSQLSRAVEQREDKRPQLSDLRESGSIEQDADAVWFVFREQYYLERAEPMRRADESDERFNDRYNRWQARCREVFNTAEVIIAKNRQGPVGTARLAFNPAWTKFGNLDNGGGDA